MDFTLTDDQAALRDSARRLFARATPATPTDLQGRCDAWAALVSLGAAGGDPDDFGPAERMVVAEELGRTRHRVPFAETVVATVLLDALASSSQRTLIDGVADGSVVAVLAHTEPRTRFSPAAYGVRAVESGGVWRLTGTKEPVGHADLATVLLVSAATDDGTRLFLVPPDADGVVRTSYVTQDRGVAARIDLDGAVGEPLGESAQAGPALALAFAHGAAVLCAEAVGAMETALWTTVEYLKTRRQFGVPLQTFQALRHRAADMFVQLELARSCVQYATMALAQDDPDLLPSRRALAQVAKSGRFVGQNAIQLHGGIGVTEEHDIGHLAGRVEAITQAFGGAHEHLTVLTDGLDLEPVELLA
jgi:alkylation response protein AidB-like acyl-CoA dehydrogenase